MRFLHTRYRKFGRGPDFYDCWGQSIDALVELFNKPRLPSLGAVDPSDKRRMTQAADETIRAYLEPAKPEPGVLALAYTGRLCVHVGLCVRVDGMLQILETDEPTGPVLTSRQLFEARFYRVDYYAVKDISQHAAG